MRYFALRFYVAMVYIGLVVVDNKGNSVSMLGAVTILAFLGRRSNFSAAILGGQI
ncbi:hypothetical protein SAMN05660830_01287 [Halodesulfovibrio aestuarii]|uniref:Uncharacterized protein n=1 Tax=Halodesulfovibrio aestuarii TaxID=126333 RepID=A0A8G2FAH7_9BACT|nr:hypothetical protein SAMN05660830_01287 [Halodesulfovibrio aestuarii]